MIPRASILISTCNRAEHLRDTLRSLQGLSIPPSLPTEIVIVDNASTDATPQVVRSFANGPVPVRYRYEPAPGKSGALNGALAASQSEIILLTDDDVRVSADWVIEMTRPLLIDRADAVAGAVRLAPYLLRDWMTLCHRKTMAEFCPDDGPAQDMIGANMGFKKIVATTIGGFAVELGAGRIGNGEDSLFYWQAKQSGFRILGLPGVEVEHHFDVSRLTRKHWLEGAANRGRSKAVMNYKWIKSAEKSPLWKIWQYQACALGWQAVQATGILKTPCHRIEMQHVENFHYHRYTRNLFRKQEDFR